MKRSSGSSIISKANSVIDVVTSAHRPLGFSEIVDGTGLVKSSCHRILAILQGEGMIDFDRNNRTYRCGPRLQGWARSVWNRADVQQAANLHMADLCETSQMNTALSILDNDEILYLRTIDYFNARFASHAGDRAPLHATAAGKVVLAYMTQKRMVAVLANLQLEVFTPHTITTREQLMQTCWTVRHQGFAVAEREEALQVTGIAAPIWSDEDEVIACLSLWSTDEFHSAGEVAARSDLLIQTTRAISTELGAKPA